MKIATFWEKPVIENQMERGSEHNYGKREITLADSCIGFDACCIGMWEAAGI